MHEDIRMKYGNRHGRWHYEFSAIVVAVLGLVLALEWSEVKPYGEFNASYYDELADAFLAGQTYFLRLPPSAMMALPDPYDPNDNESFRIHPEIPGERYTGVHDLSLYNGRLYLLYGPVPALMLIPLRAMVGHDPPLGYGILVLTTVAEVGYLTSAWLLARLCGLVPTRLTGSLMAVSLLLCPFWTFNLGRIAVYEIAIFTGQFFVALAFLSVSAAFHARLVQGREYPVLLGLGSLFLGLALGCRPELAVVGLMLPIVLFLWWRSDPRRSSWWRMAGPAAALALPAGACLAGILVYNYIRFGNILEVGMATCISSVNMPEHKFHYLRLVRLIPNLLYFFLAPPKISMASVPHLLPNIHWPPRWMSPETIAAYEEPKEAVVGLFAVAPMAAVALIVPLLFSGRLSAGAAAADRRVGPTLLMLVLPALLAAAPTLLLPARLRYGAEWCMPWIMIGGITAMWIEQRLETAGSLVGLFLFRLGIILVIVWSAWVGISFLYWSYHYYLTGELQ
jgi:hypothetical protein